MDSKREIIEETLKEENLCHETKENNHYEDSRSYASSFTGTASECDSVSKARKDKNNKATKNKTFNYFQIREIEQDNNVLMKKVLAHSTRRKQYTTNEHVPKISSAEVNRKKLQKKIDHENLVIF